MNSFLYTLASQLQSGKKILQVHRVTRLDTKLTSVKPNTQHY